MHLLLGNVAADPPKLARAIVQCVWWRGQTGGHWSNACLKQVGGGSSVCSISMQQHVTTQMATVLARPAHGSEDEAALAAMCHSVLLSCMCSTAALHGSAPRRRSVRLVQQLQPVPGHMALLEQATSTTPALAAALLQQGWTWHALEPPAASFAWLAAMDGMVQLVRHAAPHLAGVAAGASKNATARKILDTLLLPPAVQNKAWFSRCLLHTSILVRHTTLQLLQVLLEAWRQARRHLLEATTTSSNEDMATSIGISLRRRMSDVQTVVASHALPSGDEVRAMG